MVEAKFPDFKISRFQDFKIVRVETPEPSASTC